MPLSWNEIRHNAIKFSHDWASASREDAEAKTFWDEFFSVFGIQRRAVASFEEPVKNVKGKYGYIDLFWKGRLLVEHKSRGKDLGRASSQAFQYIQDLINEGRHNELPRHVIVSDFARIALHDLEPEGQRDLPLFDQWRVQTTEITLENFYKHIHDFAFIPGYKQHIYEAQDPINIEAVNILGNLHDALEAGGYKGHELERFLVRVLFCLFAEDTGIFESEAFHLYIENRTSPDGSDLGLHLARLFEVLNTPIDKRQINLDETLSIFPFVNGDLFSEHLGFADFNRDMRNALVECTRFDWAQISPAVFGSLFQAVMEPAERRQTGGHYTSERDILKVVRSLFLDELKTEYTRIKNNKAELKRFHQKLATLRFMDPACGCGNFLVITYRELRLLEIELLKDLYGDQQVSDISQLSLLDVDAFYGIEIQEWPALIAEVAMWLIDHQMNIQLSAAFGEYFVRLPLKKSPTIVKQNALRIDWKKILSPEKCGYILGNPPFIGAKYQNDDQRADMKHVTSDIKHGGLLDYVAGWYFKAGQYIRGTEIKVGFVSTNSISQGEQVGILWRSLFQKYGLKIHFAYRTFPWESEARGKAHVHVVIIGFGSFETSEKRIYEHQEEGQSTVHFVKNISPYIVEGSDMVIINRSKPISNVPEMNFGNQPIDGGAFILSDTEKRDMISQEPASKKYIRLFIGSQEFINGETRWCLWLNEASPTELRSMPEVMNRIEAVRKFRKSSKRPATRDLAASPSRFAFISHPNTEYLLVPSVSSEKRRFIPLGFMPKTVIASNLCLIIPCATLYHFGVLSSTMHMSWVRQVCGRLESRYRYSAKLVYNNYPWSEKTTSKQKQAVEKAARDVLEAREKYPDSTLADLYDPLTMPSNLIKAHSNLDRAVDLCYRSQPFTSERQRVEYLFWLYGKITEPLTYVERRKITR